MSVCFVFDAIRRIKILSAHSQDTVISNIIYHSVPHLGHVTLLQFLDLHAMPLVFCWWNLPIRLLTIILFIHIYYTLTSSIAIKLILLQYDTHFKILSPRLVILKNLIRISRWHFAISFQPDYCDLFNLLQKRTNKANCSCINSGDIAFLTWVCKYVKTWKFQDPKLNGLFVPHLIPSYHISFCEMHKYFYHSKFFTHFLFFVNEYMLLYTSVNFQTLYQEG